MATAKKKPVNLDKITTRTTTYKMRKHKGVHITVFINKKMLYLLWFKPQTGYHSYAWAYVGPLTQKVKYYCGKKKMMAAFLAHFKEHYG